MKARHLALIVEDDSATAEDLAEILRSLDCDSMVADNRQDALASLQNHDFCLVLLDLEIKDEPDSIKGHTAHGYSLLREIRGIHTAHTGSSYWMPILVISGFAHEVSAAVEVMQDGASSVVQKPFNSRIVSHKVKEALERSGRILHTQCGRSPGPPPDNAGGTIILSIPGDPERRRTRVMLGSRVIRLTNGSLKVLLQLMVAYQQGHPVHKRLLGARDDQGFKGISVLREALKPVLPDGVDIIGNDYHGSYYLTDNVTIGACDIVKLAGIGDARITEIAQELERLLDTHNQKSLTETLQVSDTLPPMDPAGCWD